MNKVCSRTLLVAVIAAVSIEVASAQVSDEFRAMWVSRFEWPSTSKSTVMSRINSIMTNLDNRNFNAVIFQVRGQMDTLYPSPHEPWSPLVSANGNAPSGWGSFDPLQYAIDAAHSHGLEFHAYINTHVGWQSGSDNPPSYCSWHPYWDYLDASTAGNHDWLIHDYYGNPTQFEESGYVWLAPGVPEFQAYLRRQVMYVVENYDVDGVHFDRIRMPGNTFSYDPISQARRAGEGNPDGLGFADWTRDQFTRMLCDLYAQINEVSPNVKVSSAPLGLYAPYTYPGYPTSDCGYLYGYSCVLQDAQAWLAAGAQDFICPQIYWADGGGNPDFSEILPDWVTNAAGRHIVAGHTAGNGVSALLSEIGVCRSEGAAGNVVWSYNTFNTSNYWNDFSGSGGPYQQAANLPDMPWKSSPTEGIIMGVITDLDGVSPVVDCQIFRDGSSYTALSSADGLYSFLKVAPGTYTLTFDKNGLDVRQVGQVVVAAGEVTRVNFSYAEPPLVGDYDDDGDVDIYDLPAIVYCVAGPAYQFAPANFCLFADSDGDLDVDMVDYAEIMRHFTNTE